MSRATGRMAPGGPQPLDARSWHGMPGTASWARLFRGRLVDFSKRPRLCYFAGNGPANLFRVVLENTFFAALRMTSVKNFQLKEVTPFREHTSIFILPALGCLVRAAKIFDATNEFYAVAVGVNQLRSNQVSGTV